MICFLIVISYLNREILLIISLSRDTSFKIFSPRLEDQMMSKGGREGWLFIEFEEEEEK